MEDKKTLVLGASNNPNKYSYLAVTFLTDKNIEVVAVGKETGYIGQVPILTEIPENIKFHTVTLYINPILQEKYMHQIIHLNPIRIIFNPGTENEKFKKEAIKNNITCLEACTLVLLKTNQY